MAAKKDSPKNSGSIIGTTIRVNAKDYERRDPQRGLEINKLSQEEIKSLQKTDPFMYYSIPSVRRDAMNLKDGGQVHGRCHPMPSDYTATQTTTIRRRSTISFEAYPSFDLDDILNDSTRRRSTISEAYPTSDFFDDTLKD